MKTYQCVGWFWALIPRLFFLFKLHYLKRPFLPWQLVSWICMCNLNLMPTYIVWLCINRGQHDTFVIVIHFIFVDWKFQDVIIGLFQAIDIIGHGLARELKAILEKFGCIFKIWSKEKNESINLGNMIMTLKLVNCYEALSLLEPFDDACFKHAMGKVAQYETNMMTKFPKTLG
jgi:hypothetical protein